MRTLLALARDSFIDALTIYGFLSLMTALIPSFGQNPRLWLVVPITFAIQMGLKLTFSRDENGKLRRAVRY